MEENDFLQRLHETYAKKVKCEKCGKEWTIGDLWCEKTDNDPSHMTRLYSLEEILKIAMDGCPRVRYNKRCGGRLKEI